MIDFTARFSPRSFDDREVPDEVLRQVFDAARWAASSFNDQPWAFLVAPRDREDEWRAILECLVEGNRSWARGAPVLGFSFARGVFARNGRENRHAWHDVGQASAHLALAAADRGLQIHQMAGFSTEAVMEAFEPPEGWRPVAGIALGYPAEEPPANRPRGEVEEFVFGGAWDRPARFV